MTWFLENQDQIEQLVALVLGLLLAVEAVVRALEALARGLVWLAKLTRTERDDAAFEGAAKKLHAAAVRIAGVTGWLRPFSLRGTPRPPAEPLDDPPKH